ncbi:MAG TPA: hypothetical protein VFH61_11880, partial [Thermoleophilia bacterium]|nr:hypothetical protein [Thermoleophilia bacterium]
MRHGALPAISGTAVRRGGNVCQATLAVAPVLDHFDVVSTVKQSPEPLIEPCALRTCDDKPLAGGVRGVFHAPILPATRRTRGVFGNHGQKRSGGRIP